MWNGGDVSTQAPAICSSRSHKPCSPSFPPLCLGHVGLLPPSFGSQNLPDSASFVLCAPHCSPASSASLFLGVAGQRGSPSAPPRGSAGGVTSTDLAPVSPCQVLGRLCGFGASGPHRCSCVRAGFRGLPGVRGARPQVPAEPGRAWAPWLSVSVGSEGSCSPAREGGSGCASLPETPDAAAGSSTGRFV